MHRRIAECKLLPVAQHSLRSTSRTPHTATIPIITAATGVQPLRPCTWSCLVAAGAVGRLSATCPQQQQQRRRGVTVHNADGDDRQTSPDASSPREKPTVFPHFPVESLLARIRQSNGVTGASLSPRAFCKPSDSAFTALTANDVVEVQVPADRRPADVLFPLDTAVAGPSRRAFVQALRACVKGNTVLIVAVACYHFVDAEGWDKWIKDAHDISFLEAICEEHGILFQRFYKAAWKKDDEFLCTQGNTLLTGFLKSITANIVSFQQPLCQLLNDKHVIDVLRRRNNVLLREKYLPSGELLATWKDMNIAGYWLLGTGFTIERNGNTIFKHLAMTDTITRARDTDGKKVTIIGGSSGTGKTCTLLSIGTSKELHIAVSMGQLADEFKDFISQRTVQNKQTTHVISAADATPGTTAATQTKEEDIQAFAECIRNGIRSRLEDALQVTTDNDVKENTVNVVLHVDEAGLRVGVRNGEAHVKRRPELRLLIHAQERLLEATLVKGPPSVWLTVRVAIAGTGLEELYDCTKGSIAGKFRVVTAATANTDTEKIVKAHLAESSAPPEALKDVVRVIMRRPEMSHVAATNYRLLSYCLMELVDQTQSPWKLRQVATSDRVYERYITLCKQHDGKGEGVDVPLRQCYDAALPYACMEGAKNFVNVNGLSQFSRRTANTLIRVAHVAYLLRAVVLPADEKDTASAELTNHGFTPVASGTEFAGLLELAAAAGVFTWSKIECKADELPCDYIAAGTTDGVHGTVVGIPCSEAPVQLSPAYVMLPRLRDGTLFTDGSPGAFERVASALLCRSLHVLGLVCGGCDRWGLYAAMCGPEYVLHFQQHIAAKDAVEDTFIYYTRAVEVNLGVWLDTDVTEMTILLGCARALREMLLQDGVSTQALDAAINESDRDKLLAEVANVMFVINPAGQSPSPDAVLLCVGSAGKRGYLTARQDKRKQEALRDSEVPDEVDKCKESLDTLETLATGNGPKVKMREFFFNLYTKSDIRTSYKLKGRTLRIHSCVRKDAFFLSSGKV